MPSINLSYYPLFLAPFGEGNAPVSDMGVVPRNNGADNRQDPVSATTAPASVPAGFFAISAHSYLRIPWQATTAPLSQLVVQQGINSVE